MILVSLGTHFQDFSRLAKAADELAATLDEEVVVQSGATKYDFKYAKHFDYCSKERMSKLIKDADVLVLQGGWGAICEAVDDGKRVVAVPRIEGIEHIHDQEQIVRKMDSMGCIIGVFDIKDLPNAVEKARTFDFKPLVRGNAHVIVEKINEWFNK